MKEKDDCRLLISTRDCPEGGTPLRLKPHVFAKIFTDDWTTGEKAQHSVYSVIPSKRDQFKTTFTSLQECIVVFAFQIRAQIKAETIFHYCLRVKSSSKLVRMESISTFNSMISNSLK